jgi:nucleoside-diphosphate-sugar epimerase
MKVLLTGATSFIGKALVKELTQQNFNISIAVRQKTNLFPDEVKQFLVKVKYDFSYWRDRIHRHTHMY